MSGEPLPSDFAHMSCGGWCLGDCPGCCTCGTVGCSGCDEPTGTSTTGGSLRIVGEGDPCFLGEVLDADTAAALRKVLPPVAITSHVRDAEADWAYFRSLIRLPPEGQT